MLDLNDYQTSNNRGYIYIYIYIYILVVIDKFSKYGWNVPLKNKNSQITSDEFSKVLTTSKWSPLKPESDRVKEFYNNIFQNFLKLKNIQAYNIFVVIPIKIHQ